MSKDNSRTVLSYPASRPPEDGALYLASVIGDMKNCAPQVFVVGEAGGAPVGQLAEN